MMNLGHRTVSPLISVWETQGSTALDCGLVALSDGLHVDARRSPSGQSGRAWPTPARFGRIADLLHRCSPLMANTNASIFVEHALNVVRVRCLRQGQRKQDRSLLRAQVI